MTRGYFKHATVKWAAGLWLLATAVWDVWAPFPVWLYGLPVLAYLVAVSAGSARVCSQFFVPAVCRGHTGQKQIALSFDDGPTAHTPAVLDLLKTYGMPATFFCVGKQIEAFPHIFRRILAEGHRVGNHSYSHSYYFGFFPASKVQRELKQTDALIAEAAGQRPAWFRPPYGATNPMIARALKKTGHTVIGWNVRSLDTLIRDEQKVVSRVLKKLKPDAIVLLHDRYTRIVPILQALLPQIKAAGYEVVPLEQLLNTRAYERP
ncbi:MAG: polysaccharide deacetylase family protein [Bacteroidetes bacterium]|nr:MAG: polysaccharide deacetylase family protein [Bacteroidota bacterium]